MKCPWCGEEMPQEAKFCIRCGHAAQKIPALQQAAPVVPPPKQKKSRARFAVPVVGAWAVVFVLLGIFLWNRWGRQIAQTPGTSGTSESGAWSEWLDVLPEGVAGEDYQLETQTLYRTRTKETTTSPQPTLDGWKPAGSSEEDGGYGAWSDWSQTAVDAAANREVETQTRYRSREKETTTSSNPNLDGWTLDNVSSSWGDYGAWSDWSTDYAAASDSRKVETKTQYSFRDKETNSSTVPIVGRYWTHYDTRTVYGSWSDWSDTKDAITPVGAEWDTRQVSTGTRYYMAHYCTGYTGDNSTGYRTSNWKFNSQCSYHALGWFDNLDKFASYEGDYLYNGSSPSNCYRCSNTCYRWYIMDTEEVYKTQYRWRSVTTVYYYYHWGNWSSYGDSYISSNSDREVRTRTLYRYCDRAENAAYQYSRWTDWGDWSETAPTPGTDVEVETALFYRYREKVSTPVYSFERWTDWSDWTAQKTDGSETTQVEEKTQYRYRARE